MFRYSSLGSYLHWVLAIIFLALLISGWSLYFDIWSSKQFIFELFQWHKSIGILALVLVGVRVCWRNTTKLPDLPSELQSEKRKIHVGHGLIYLLIIIMPLSGWALVSTDPKGIPTLFFGLFEWWHLPLSNTVFRPAEWLHFSSAIVLSVVLIGHIVFAFQHHRQGVAIFQRILPNHVVKIAIFTTFLFITGLSLLVFYPASAVKYNKQNEILSKEQVWHSSEVNNISFSGEHAGNLFTGTFKKWNLKTDIDFKQQTMRYFKVEVSTGSVDTGSSINDQTLLEYDWFNVVEFPSAIFISEAVEFLDAKRAKISGQFTIKNISKPLELFLIYDDSMLNTEFVIKRTDYQLGQEADPDAEWVSEEISVIAKALINQQ